MIKAIDRITQFIEHAGLSARQFDISIGASNGYTLRMKKNNASVGSDVIENIIRIYPQLNLVWLITGEGEMLNPDKELLKTGQLPAEKEREIEQIIEAKIRARQEQELKDLLKAVNEEIERREKEN